MKLLAIDTATEACSAAILTEAGVIERYRVAPREHNQLILPMVEEVLAEAGLHLTDLDALAFGRGPGAFTGVRIAAGVAQGLAFGAGLPVVPVSTLAALALDALDESGHALAFPCIDARMGEVYWGVYRRTGTDSLDLLGEERVLPASTVPQPPAGPGAGTGSGWATYGEILRDRLGGAALAVMPERFPRAATVARLGAAAYARCGGLPPGQAVPLYLRDDVARKPAHVPPVRL